MAAPLHRCTAEAVEIMCRSVRGGRAGCQVRGAAHAARCVAAARVALAFAAESSRAVAAQARFGCNVLCLVLCSPQAGSALGLRGCAPRAHGSGCSGAPPSAHGAVRHAHPPATRRQARPLISLWRAPARAQAGRVLSVLAVPGRHPLRALAAADGAVRTLAPDREWAKISWAPAAAPAPLRRPLQELEAPRQDLGRATAPQRAIRGPSVYAIAGRRCAVPFPSPALTHPTTQVSVPPGTICLCPFAGLPPAACESVGAFAADDTLCAVLLRERAALGEAVSQLTRAAWDEAEDPCVAWATGQHVSFQGPALAAVLLGDVQGESARGDVALSPAGVVSVVSAVAAVMARPSSTGARIWSVCGPAQVYYAYT